MSKVGIGPTNQLDGFLQRRQANASLSVHDFTDKTLNTSVEDVSDRLFRNEKKIIKEKTADDAILSTLPSNTLRFMKRRRKLNSFDKVPLTHYRERQLRGIFKGLDFDKMGNIHLDLVKDAADYAEEKLKPKLRNVGAPVFVNLNRMFAAMDEDGNGDGEVDFHEFTIAMTGSSTSTIDSVDEGDVERLTKRFMEFANIKKREYALNAINEAKVSFETQADFSSSEGVTNQVAAPKTFNNLSTGVTAGGVLPPLMLYGDEEDADKIPHFKTCFSVFNGNINDDVLEREEKRYYEKKGIVGVGRKNYEESDDESSVGTTCDGGLDFVKKTARTQEILDIFLESITEFNETRKSESSITDEKKKKEEDFQKIQEKYRDIRIVKAESAMKDPEARENEERVLDEKEYVKKTNSKPWLMKSVGKYFGGFPLPTKIPYSCDNILKRDAEFKRSARIDVAKLKKTLTSSKSFDPRNFPKSNRSISDNSSILFSVGGNSAKVVRKRLNLVKKPPV